MTRSKPNVQVAMVSHIHGIEYGEWEFKHTVAVRRLSFTGWIDVFARRMPEDDEASLRDAVRPVLGFYNISIDPCSSRAKHSLTSTCASPQSPP